MSERTLKGLNWGQVTLDENCLSVDNKGKNLFKVPFKKILNSTVSKNDIIIELNTDDLNNE